MSDPYAIVRDTPASWEDYRLETADLREEPPEGLLIRVAGPTPEGVRVIEIWRSREELERFAVRPGVTLGPATVRELAVAYLLHPNRKET